MKFSAITLFLSSMLLVGCMGEKRTYSVSVKNDSSRPITLGLVKDAPPYNDENWASPEDIAMSHSRVDDATWGVAVPPGKTGTAGPVDARFSSDGSAWLRVYAGQPALPEMLAVSHGSPNRLDIRLRQGENHFVVTGSGGALSYERAGPSTAPVASR